jgi:hypothetical protein
MGEEDCMWIALLAGAALADGPHEIDVAWSVGGRARLDRVMSPLVHGAFTPFGGVFAYRWRGPKAALTTGFEFDSVPGRSGPTWEYPIEGGTASTWPSSWVTVRIPVGWGVDVVRSDAWAVVVGGLFDARIEVLSWSYAVTWTTGYSGAFTLGPWLDVRWAPHPRWTIEASLTAPLAGWVARSPYALNDDEYIAANQSHNPIVAFGAYFADGHAAWIGTYQAVRTRMGAAYAFHDRLSITLAWRFEVLHDPSPLPVTAYAHFADVGIRARF